jgi:hypothetical protein
MKLRGGMGRLALDCGDMSPLWLHGEVGEHGYKSSAVVFEQRSQSVVVPPQSKRSPHHFVAVALPHLNLVFTDGFYVYNKSDERYIFYVY